MNDPNNNFIVVEEKEILESLQSLNQLLAANEKALSKIDVIPYTFQ